MWYIELGPDKRSPRETSLARQHITLCLNNEMLTLQRWWPGWGWTFEQYSVVFDSCTRPASGAGSDLLEKPMCETYRVACGGRKMSVNLFSARNYEIFIVAVIKMFPCTIRVCDLLGAPRIVRFDRRIWMTWSEIPELRSELKATNDIEKTNVSKGELNTPQ